VGISLEDKMAKNVKMAIKIGITKQKAEDLATSTLPKLKRWQK